MVTFGGILFDVQNIMEEDSTLPGPDKYVFTIIGYLAGIALIVLAHSIEPTNLAGPGLDIPVFLLVLITACVLTMRKVIAMVNHKKPFAQLVIIHMIGNCAIICVLFL